MERSLAATDAALLTSILINQMGRGDPRHCRAARHTQMPGSAFLPAVLGAPNQMRAVSFPARRWPTAPAGRRLRTAAWARDSARRAEGALPANIPSPSACSGRGWLFGVFGSQWEWLCGRSGVNSIPPCHLSAHEGRRKKM
jgi:hypothetical protein